MGVITSGLALPRLLPPPETPPLHLSYFVIRAGWCAVWPTRRNSPHLRDNPIGVKLHLVDKMTLRFVKVVIAEGGFCAYSYILAPEISSLNLGYFVARACWCVVGQGRTRICEIQFRFI